MLPKKPKALSRLSSLIGILVIVVLGLLIYFNRQWIVDEINYLTFKPSATLQSFAKRSAMSQEGQFLFYSARPSLEEATQFNEDCPSQSPTSAVLGCYDGRYIYIYNITDTRLDGIRETTAAYEMLHAAYKRQSPSDLKALNSLIEETYNVPANKKMLSSSVEYFSKTEPGERDDELFSLIATEVKTVDPKLEKIYSKYFTNRQTLVNLYEKYQSVFENYKDQAASLQQQIQTMQDDINTKTAAYDADMNQLNSDIAAFNAAAANGGFSSQAAFDDQRAALTTRVNTLNDTRAAINSEIDQYNDLVKQFNAVQVTQQGLYKSINSVQGANKI